MFLETSHHRNIPFWAKNIPYLEGGEGGETKGLNFFTYPRQFFNPRPPLKNGVWEFFMRGSVGGTMAQSINK